MEFGRIGDCEKREREKKEIKVEEKERKRIEWRKRRRMIEGIEMRIE